MHIGHAYWTGSPIINRLCAMLLIIVRVTCQWSFVLSYCCPISC